MGQFCYCSLSPQGDDNRPLAQGSHADRIAAYPRKGTIMRPSFFKSSMSGNCSLSPQGDDNLSDLNGSYKMAIAAYPRKGTIILFIDGKLYDGFIAAYPRKGTITSHQSARRTTCTDYSLSPQGDDNLTKLMVWGVQFNYSLSPQGDDNSFLSTYTIYLRDCSLSPQGDDNLIILLSIMLLLNCSLSPQGGKKLRIKKRCGVFLLQTLTLCFPWAVPL